MDQNTQKIDELTAIATKHIADILNYAINHRKGERALVVYDTQNGLTKILTQAYRNVLPHAQFVDFDSTEKDEVIRLFNELSPNDLVVLVQSSNFLLDAFRIRLHLFQRKLKVIEHVHLYRNSEAIWDVYINALAYDPSWYRVVGQNLKRKLEQCKTLTIKNGDASLRITGGLESPKPNLGDYTGMENIGGTFPIGEVFTESKDFSQMNGSLMIYAFAGSDFSVNMHKPFRIEIENGIVVSWQKDAPEMFGQIVAMIKSHERPLIREIGFGLNRAITRDRYPEDITAFERILGLHCSLGEKHSVYKKEGITTHKSKYHVDLFPLAQEVLADNERIFYDGKYTVS